MTNDEMLNLAMQRADQARREGRLASVTVELYKIQAEQEGEDTAKE